MSDNLGERLRMLQEEIAAEVILSGVALLARQIIEERTLAGRYLEGGGKPYSKAYARKRQKRGLQTARVDLQFSGAAWGSFDHALDVRQAEISLGFNRDELARIMSYHDEKGAGKNRVVRAFMGLTDQEQEKVAEYILEKAGKRIDVLLEKNLPE